jgi:hypothetical protein
VHLEVDQPGEIAGQVLDVHAGAAVDLGRVLTTQQGDAHGTDSLALGIVTGHSGVIGQ